MSSMPKSVEIDPRGDTLIKLKNPKWDLPEWVDSYHPPDPMPDASSSEQSSTAGHQGTIITSNPIFTHQWLVSSNQLRLASRYFDNMFANFAEGEKAEDGKYHVDAEGFHPHALGMALYVLHGVKRPGFFYLSLELVVHVARVVDYYQMHGMIIHLAASYMDEIRDRKGLRSMIALPYGKNVMLWLSAAYVFDQPYTFNECSSVIIMKGAEPLQELELPYPGNLFSELSNCRTSVAHELIESLKRLVIGWKQGFGGARPNWTCRSTLIGALEQIMFAHRVAQDHPQPHQTPYMELRLVDLCDDLLRATGPNIDPICACHESGISGQPCTLISYVKPIVDAAYKKSRVPLERFLRHP